MGLLVFCLFGGCKSFVGVRVSILGGRLWVMCFLLLFFSVWNKIKGLNK